MNTQIKSILFIISLILIVKFTKSNFLQINPTQVENTKETTAKNDSISNIEKYFENSNPLFTVFSTGYLTISTIKNVIVYPFSEKLLKINVFYQDGSLLLQDQNLTTLWAYDIKSEKRDEVKVLSFINRGSLLLKDKKDERIWPFNTEELSKKINLDYVNGSLKLTDKNNHEVWTSSQINEKSELDSLENNMIISV